MSFVKNGFEIYFGLIIFANAFALTHYRLKRKGCANMRFNLKLNLERIFNYCILKNKI